MLKKYISLWDAWRQASANRKIFSAALVVIAVTLVVKVVSAGKEIVIADYFGTSNMVDAFLFAYILPAFFINVLAVSFQVALMPTYIRIRDNKGTMAANQLFSSVLLIGVLLLVVVSVILAITAPALLALLGSGFDVQTVLSTQTLFYYLLPVMLVTGAGHLFSTVIHADKHFVLVALAPIITPLCTIIALLTRSAEWGIYALVFGVVAGAMLEVLVLIISTKRRHIPVLPRWHGMTPELRVVIGQYTPMIAGALLMSSTVLVDQSMAAMLEPGSVATLSYANKVVAAILGVGAMALGTAILPYFSEMVGNNDWGAIKHTLKTCAGLIIVSTVPVTILLFIFSNPLVELLFERGAFTAQDTQRVAQTQAYYVLQLPFYMLGILGVRLISAMARNDILMKIAGISLVANIGGNYLLMPYFGVAGIALSTAFVYMLVTPIQFVFLYTQLKKGTR